MSFKSENIRVIMPLDPNGGECYIENVREDLDEVDLDHFYNFKCDVRTISILQHMGNSVGLVFVHVLLILMTY